MGYSYEESTGLLKKLGHRDVNFAKSPNAGRALRNPSLIVNHFTGSGGVDESGDVGWFSDSKSKVSAHFVIGRDGGLTQCVPLDRVAWHAGRSIWRGTPLCNNFSIGIEFDNWGKLQGTPTRRYTSYTGTSVDLDDIVIDPSGNAWEAYPEVQLQTGAELHRALKAILPSLKEVVGHSDVAPGRKIDPGFAFDMNRMRNAFEGRGDDLDTLRLATVNARSGLNLRGGPSTGYDKFFTLPYGTKVTIQYDDGAWSFVTFFDNSGNIMEGWVATRYLSL